MPAAPLLQIATRYLAPILAVLSLLVLYRGHNLPGGGFIGGLLLAAAILLVAIAEGWDVVNKKLPVDPLTLLTLGLGIALLSGLPSLFFGQPYLTGQWLPGLELPIIGKVKLGTPIVFDLGVYFAVTGFTLKCANAFAEES